MRSRKSLVRWFDRELSQNRLNQHHGSVHWHIPKKANGKLRICLDPKDLNKSIIQENSQSSNPWEITHMSSQEPPNSPKWMATKLSSGCTLQKEASLLTTFNTHLGRYRFLHVPFGLKMSQDIFQMWNGWYCGTVSRSTGNPWWHIYIWERWQRPWHEHHKFVQCSPKRGTCFQQREMLHKTRFCDILWRCIFS